MTKHDGVYYLQFAAPGTEFKTYGDGVLTSKNPMGPFTYPPYNPFSFKPTGFVAGAGHGSTFTSPFGQWWHISTMSVSVRHPFERRLGLFPAQFTSDGELLADTYLGDYPHYLDGSLTGWMLLSRHKAASASSTLNNHSVAFAVDEDIRTWWSARTGNAEEWLMLDLGAPKTIQAVQINFADQDSIALGISNDAYLYVLEISTDAKHWRTAIDHSKDGRDSPHDYEVLPDPVSARYVRLRNVHSPNGAKFSISDLRVFGSGRIELPERVAGVKAVRDVSDSRHVTVSWHSAQRADFYVVRLGANPQHLNLNYQVYDAATSVRIPSLDKSVRYSITVDAVNEHGITRGGEPISVPIALSGDR